MSASARTTTECSVKTRECVSLRVALECSLLTRINGLQRRHAYRHSEELKINEEEGTPGGSLFRAVNAIADGLKDEYPNVAIDTLAYQWSRPAPKITKPRENVIIRLCSIECNFAVPLTGQLADGRLLRRVDPAVLFAFCVVDFCIDTKNVKFQTDMSAWSKVSNRTFIWNYITNFGK